jgi:hypothetical protein
MFIYIYVTQNIYLICYIPMYYVHLGSNSRQYIYWHFQTGSLLWYNDSRSPNSIHFVLMGNILTRHHTPHSGLHQICSERQNYRFNYISAKFTNSYSLCAHNLNNFGLAIVILMSQDPPGSLRATSTALPPVNIHLQLTWTNMVLSEMNIQS